MTPAMPTGRLIRDHQHVVESLISLPSSSVIFSPPREARFEPALQLGEIVGVHGLAQLEHHVLRDVDHRADGRSPARRRRSRSHGGEGRDCRCRAPRGR
jgi:hypothetical protein